mmetsp:Transcript_1010/g.1661  ORF Transcript_1010/g.1661 Transcript_1010/m.1661 type:complete len:164 (+) Transcript_1010:84-575(+)
MDRTEPDKSPADEWSASVDATCNRLMSNYLSLIRAAASSSDANNHNHHESSSTDQAAEVGSDPRAGGGLMRDADDPPPPLAANIQMSAVQAKLAVENLCVASSHALDLIRTLRLSALLMDEEAIRAEEEEEALDVYEKKLEAEEECILLEQKLHDLRNKGLKR